MKARRILALIGVILLALLYISTLVLAILGNENTMNLFILSIACTIMIPLIIHLFMMLTNARKGKSVMDETYSYREKKEDDKNEADNK